MTAAGRSDVGRIRSNNEDAFCVVDLVSGNGLTASALSAAVEVSDRRTFLGLSDGMGGHASGEIASALVLDVLSTTLQRSAAVPLEHVSVSTLVDGVVSAEIDGFPASVPAYA